MPEISDAIHAILFDKDGTLFDFYKTWGPVTEEAALLVAKGDPAKARHILKGSGKDLDTGKYIPGSPIASGSNREISDLWADLAGRTDYDVVYEEVHKLFLKRQATAATPVTDLDLLFGRLRARGLSLGVATMDSEESARASMARFGVHGSLDFICGFDTGHGVKPGGGMVEAFARHVNLRPAMVAVVGDSPHDMAMARAGGAGKAIGVLTGVSHREHLMDHGAHIVIESIAELEAIL
ncbi:HAD family hydrolase [Dongia sp.]|uniref:HAD family hydrolase n=1 Tax=Dongia sp. TaxID=1977262 RepID=UPI0035AEF164